MSKVYIEGMEMPKSCSDCKFCSGYDSFAYCDIAEFTIDNNDKERSSICPLREDNDDKTK